MMVKSNPKCLCDVYGLTHCYYCDCTMSDCEWLEILKNFINKSVTATQHIKDFEKSAAEQEKAEAIANKYNKKMQVSENTFIFGKTKELMQERVAKYIDENWDYFKYHNE